MIERLLGLEKLASKIQVAHRFNATLPILLEVMKKTKAQHYLLKVGNQILETKSLRELEIGKKYYALMQHNSLGKLMLSHLQPKPEVPDYLPFTLSALKEVLEQKEGMEDFKEKVLSHFLKAQNKEEMMGLAFFLLGMQKGVLSFWVDEEEKRRLIQLKPKKKEIEFYACFPHLGAMSGKIYDLDEGMRLELFVGYQSIVDFLIGYQDQLVGFQSCYFGVQENISALFVLENQLLDLRA